MLHIHCGDSSAATLRRSGVPGDVLVWLDLLHEGPAPAGLTDDAWRRTRADFLATSAERLTPLELLLYLQGQDDALAAALTEEEIVLWFDACLYDQLILIRQLDWFARQNYRGRLTLLCVGAFPGFATFAGLGELSPEQLASLLPARAPVTPAQTALAQAAWAAFRAPEPKPLLALLDAEMTALPYLRAALCRHLQQFPATANGLSRLEQEALAALADGVVTPGALFCAVSAREDPPFFGDTLLWFTLERMAAGAAPLVTLDGPGPLPRFDSLTPPALDAWTLGLTPAGRAVLAGEADAIRLNGIDRWYGGIHLTGDHVWRWDGTTLVATI